MAWTVVALVTPVAFPTFVALAATRHDAVAQASTHAGAMPCAEGMDTAPMAVVAHVGHRAGPHGGSRGNDHRCCTCFGPCCHAAPAVFARAPHAPNVLVTIVPLRPTAPTLRVRYYPTAPEHARPPSIGPPAGLSV